MLNCTTGKEAEYLVNKADEHQLGKLWFIDSKQWYEFNISMLTILVMQIWKGFKF